MKVKQSADDFQVEEITDVVGGPDGPFAFYRLDKSGWTTPDALAAIRQRWKVDLRRISCGGLKDRHARTSQFLTIHHGPRRGLEHHAVRLHYLGQLAAPFTSDDIRCNRFRITVRDLDPAREADVDARLAMVGRQGVPNYFDDQRFGSVRGPGGEFIARHLVAGRFEEALRLALVEPYAFDGPAQRRAKQTLRDHWGDWEECLRRLPRGPDTPVLEHLRVRGGDFRGAAARLRPDLRSLYLSAYQSHLWNRVLARWLTDHAGVGLFPIALRLGPVPFPGPLGDKALAALAGLRLPLPTARWRPAPDDPRLPAVEAVLAEEGLTLRDLQVPGVRELFFSRGERAAMAPVEGLEHAWGDDERHPGRRRLTLGFTLPKGSYATLVVKAVAG